MSGSGWASVSTWNEDTDQCELLCEDLHESTGAIFGGRRERILHQTRPPRAVVDPADTTPGHHLARVANPVRLEFFHFDLVDRVAGAEAQAIDQPLAGGRPIRVQGQQDEALDLDREIGDVRPWAG